MAETSNKQPLSIRASDDVKARFQELAEGQGLKGNDALNLLLDAYEKAQAQVAYPEHAATFKDFDSHLKSISDSFRNAYNMLENVKAAAEQEFRRDLENKEELINGYVTMLNDANVNIETLKQEKADAENIAKESEEARQKAEDNAAQLAQDKEDLREQLDGLKQQLEESKNREIAANERANECSAKLGEVSELRDKIAELERELTDAKHRLELKEQETQNKASENESLKAQLKEEKARANELQNALVGAVAKNAVNETDGK